MIAFIDDHRGAYGVEPICSVLASIGNMPQAEAEARYYEQLELAALAA